MPDGQISPVRGLHRHRAFFVSGPGGFCLSEEPESAVTARFRGSAREGRAVSLVIADCRLLEPGNPAAALFPEQLRNRIAGGDQPGANADANADEKILGRFRTFAPWVGAILTAATGFLIFFLRTG